MVNKMNYFFDDRGICNAKDCIHYEDCPNNRWIVRICFLYEKER